MNLEVWYFFIRSHSLRSIEIAASAAKALKNALHTKAGVTFLNIFDVHQDIPQDAKPEFFLYSEPFKPQRTKKVCFTFQNFNLFVIHSFRLKILLFFKISKIDLFILNFLFLQGFQLSQGSQTQSQPLPKPSGIEFLAFAGSENLWSPGLMAFDDWIKELTTVLISTGAVEDEIYAQTASVCQLDVSSLLFILKALIRFRVECEMGIK